MFSVHLFGSILSGSSDPEKLLNLHVPQLIEMSSSLCYLNGNLTKVMLLTRVCYITFFI